MLKIKKFIKKIIIRILQLQIDKDGILTLSGKLPFVSNVILKDGETILYLSKANQSYVLDLKSVNDLSNYSIYLNIQFISLSFKIKVPVNIVKLLSRSHLYTAYMKEPIQKGLIVFESFFGKSYSGQPKYIYEYLLLLKLPYTYIWTYQSDSHRIPGDPKVVRRGSTEYFKVLATAEYWVNNIVFPVDKKREETTYLQTWHGTPLKRLGFDIKVEGPEAEARDNFYKESRNWDYLVTQNRYTSEILKRAFKFDKKIIESGYPHNDILVANDLKEVDEIKDNLDIPHEKKVILYAPTWRDNDANGHWTFNFSLKIDLEKWQKVLGHEYVILIRMHHLVTNINGLDEAKGFAYNVSSYDDVQELSLISDILITDYSSVFFDYAVTRKPILFYAYDLKEYAEKLRGFYLDMHEDMPGPIIQNDDALLDAVANCDHIEKQYADKYNIFIKKFCYLDNGSCSEQVAKIVFKDIHA